MKIIDLLNKIANGEEVPKKIKYNDKIYIAKGNVIENFVDYCSDEDEWCFNHYVRYENLNDEVEIIEDNKKIEKLNIDDIDYFTMNNKINEIIDILNEMREE